MQREMNNQNFHTKRYIHMQEDIHFSKGNVMSRLADTSNDMHGDGFLGGANAGRS